MSALGGTVSAINPATVSSTPGNVVALPRREHPVEPDLPLPQLRGVWNDDYIDSERHPTVLLLDANDLNRRLLRAMLKTAPYRLFEARRASEALEILERENVDLLILDLMMPEMSGPDFCRAVKSNKRTQFIPILMLTGVQGIENEIASIASGADEFLTKPLHPEVARTRIRAMLRNKMALDTLEEAENILFTLAQAVEKRDRYTGNHCERLAIYSVALGRALGLPKSQLIALHRGGFLHDIGKICIPDAILFKKGKLNEDEWRVMKSHTVKGEEICRPMKTLANVLPIIRSHHERWDGSGYPDGLVGEEIPLLARILQIVDIYDALTTARSYKPALTHEEAQAVLEEEVRRKWRDPELVPLFFECCPRLLAERAERELSVSQSLDNMRTELLR